MIRSQKIALGAVALLFCVLYFGMDTKPKKQRLLEKSRVENLESTSIQLIAKEAKEKLSSDNKAIIEMLEIQLKEIEDDSLKTPLFQQLSSSWFKIGHPALAGYYAEQIAERSGTEDAWSIAGTSYLYGVKNYEEQKLKDFCFKRAIGALEKAASINPDNLDHKINLALGYADYPPKDNPMKGILQLIDLNKKNPENVKVLNQLARLGLETNQVEKAIGRLEKALSISPDNEFTICLLAKAYRAANNEKLAESFDEKCRQAINKK